MQSAIVSFPFQRRVRGTNNYGGWIYAVIVKRQSCSVLVGVWPLGASAPARFLGRICAFPVYPAHGQTLLLPIRHQFMFWVYSVPFCVISFLTLSRTYQPFGILGVNLLSPIMTFQKAYFAFIGNLATTISARHFIPHSGLTRFSHGDLIPTSWVKFWTYSVLVRTVLWQARHHLIYSLIPILILLGFDFFWTRSKGYNSLMESLDWICPVFWYCWKSSLLLLCSKSVFYLLSDLSVIPCTCACVRACFGSWTWIVKSLVLLWSFFPLCTWDLATASCM